MKPARSSQKASVSSVCEEELAQTKTFSYRQQVLKEKIGKYKIYEDYLLKTLDYFPSCKLASLC